MSRFDEDYLRSLSTNELRIRREVLSIIIQGAKDQGDPTVDVSRLPENLQLLDDILSSREDYDPTVPVDLGPSNRARKLENDKN